MENTQILEVPKKSSKKTLFLVLLGIFILIAGYIVYSIFVARSIARDAKRQADISQIAAALELYAYDYQGYPQNLNDLLKKERNGPYFSSVPIAPKPADGPCSNEQNQYIYKRTSPIKYELSYCIGRSGVSRNFLTGQTKAINAGIQKVNGSYR